MTIDLTYKKDELKKKIDELQMLASVDESGYVYSIADGIAICRGISKAFLDELVIFESGNFGIVRELLEYESKVVLFNNSEEVCSGMKVFRTKEQMNVPVSSKVIGRVIDPFGRSLDGLGEIDHSNSQKYNIERPAPKMVDRQPVSRPLNTGIIAIDSMIQIGLGQRELILGDMQTGKTSMALNMIINQRQRYLENDPIYCFYVAIGQRMDNVKAVQKRLIERGAMEYTTIVCTSASDSAHLQYIAPYSACSMAEFFMNKGKDCLIIFDDLSKHSVAKREIARLLRMPAGRDAFPADSFYDHSRLLERAACIRKESGGGSITAIPIIETQDGDISAYIPTNVISITDGQIFLDKNRFNLQQRPAIDIGLSVSRVGSSAQSSALRKVSKSMKGQISQYEELLKFAQFAATSLDSVQQKLIQNGKELGLLLTQKENREYSEAEEVLLIAGCHYGVLSVANNFREADIVKEGFLDYVKQNYNRLFESIKSSSSISDEDLKIIEKLSNDFVKEYISRKNSKSSANEGENAIENEEKAEQEGAS